MTEVWVAIVVPLVTAFMATTLLRIPNPARLIRVLTTANSRASRRFPARTASASPDPSPFPARPTALPNTVPWTDGHIPTSQFLAVTKTNALLVVRNGYLAHEWYGKGVDAATPLASWSVAKSIVSLLVGNAVADGRLRESDRLVDLLPELHTGSGYDDITVTHLLDMTSGIAVPEEYRSWLPLSGTARMYLTRDLPGFTKRNRGLEFAPGSRGAYRSVNTQLLGQILTAVERKTLAALLEERLWGPIGAEDPATWNLDRPGGTEKAFCAVNATARDFAKIGQLVLDNGRSGHGQVVPAAWIRRITEPAVQVDEWGYSAQWWHPPGGDGDLTALGVYGQYVYVDTTARTVIVKLSDHGAEQDELESIHVLRYLSRAPGSP